MGDVESDDPAELDAFMQRANTWLGHHGLVLCEGRVESIDFPSGKAFQLRAPRLAGPEHILERTLD